MDQFMWGGKINKCTDDGLQYDNTSKRLPYYNCTYHCLSHMSCVLSCSLFYCVSGLFADMGGIVTGEHEVLNRARKGEGNKSGGGEGE